MLVVVFIFSLLIPTPVTDSTHEASFYKIKNIEYTTQITNTPPQPSDMSESSDKPQPSDQPQNSSLQARANAVLNTSRFGIGGAAFRVGAKAGFVDTVPFGAFPRSVIEQVGLMREDLARGEDNEYNSRIHKNGYKIYFDPEIHCAYFARATVGASMRQMYSNGLSIGQLFYIDKKSIGIRHIVPMLFVLSILLTLILSLFCPFMIYILIAILSAYVFVDILATILECIKNGWVYVSILPWLFFLIHISYGCGTIVGLIKYKQ
jgi:hypothetical protein